MTVILGLVASNNYTQTEAPEYKDALQDLGDHSSLRHGCPQKGTRAIFQLKRKPEGSYSQLERSPKRPKHHAPPSQVQRTWLKGSARVRFDSATYLSIYIRAEAGDKVRMEWDETMDLFVCTDVPGRRIYQADISDM
ncbi:hypothetical protein F5Y17DRAFT_453442, partial [Xylariaceae sp. FL0594]